MTEPLGTPGYRPADMADDAQRMRERHRSGAHAGRMLDSDCPDCFPPPLEGEKDPDPWPHDGYEEPVEKETRDLWVALNQSEMDRVIPKAVEYGAADLQIMGFALTTLLNSPRARSREWSPEEGEELASAFYALGKIARAFGAYAEGRLANEDTWHDLGVYARMIQIIRLRGGWM